MMQLSEAHLGSGGLSAVGAEETCLAMLRGPPPGSGAGRGSPHTLVSPTLRAGAAQGGFRELPKGQEVRVANKITARGEPKKKR